MNPLIYERQVIAYHGCDAAVRDRVIQRGGVLQMSRNDYDWLGQGIYFWEHGPERALEWAKGQKERGRIGKPAVLGAVLNLGQCFDLLDAANTDVLSRAHPRFCKSMTAGGKEIPKNEPLHPKDRDNLLRRLDCAVINWAIDQLEKQFGVTYHSVRGVFQEGELAYPESGIRRRSHIQIAVRHPACIVGYFLPSS